MALAVASTSTNTEVAGATTLVITKPTGLAAGDLMIAHIANFTASGAITPPTGFTSIRSDTNVTPSNFQSTLYYKIAESGDASATNFTFTFANSGVSSGALMRVTGHDGQTPVQTSAGDATVDDDQTPSFSISVTPTYAQSLLLFFPSHSSDLNGVSAYAVTTDNPTWTEMYDVGNTGGDNCNIAGAYAVRTETTATGNATCSGDAVTNDWVGQMLVISPPFIDQTETSTLSDTLTSVGEYYITSTDSVTGTDTLSNASGATTWANQTKNTATFLNQDKN